MVFLLKIFVYLEHPDVVLVTPNHYYQMQTTRTFDYLGLYEYENTPKELLPKANMGDHECHWRL